MQGKFILKMVVCALFLGLTVLGCKSKEGAGITNIPKFAGASQNGNKPQGPGGNGNNPQNPLPPGNVGGNGGNPNGTDIGGNNNPNEPLNIPENYQEQRNVFVAVHFDYDSSELRPQDMELVAQVAQHLTQNPNHMLLIEGHCDERGTEEYNLSLGERRALSVAEELARLGVGPERLGTQSFGEKVPVSESNTKEARSKNRRGEFVLFMPAGGIVEVPQ